MAFETPVKEAKLEPTECGRVRKTAGWFVVNTKDAQWRRHERFGDFCSFEGEERFQQMGINIHVLQPGQPNCHYHRETTEENFLVLSGECLLLVEGEERKLKAWDFVHCAPGTAHVFVGSGSGPCAILMTGTRTSDEKIEYPVEPLAVERGAGVTKATWDPQESYAGIPRSTPHRSEWPPR